MNTKLLVIKKSDFVSKIRYAVVCEFGSSGCSTEIVFSVACLKNASTCSNSIYYGAKKRLNAAQRISLYNYKAQVLRTPNASKT